MASVSHLPTRPVVDVRAIAVDVAHARRATLDDSALDDMVASVVDAVHDVDPPDGPDWIEAAEIAADDFLLALRRSDPDKVITATSAATSTRRA